MTTLRQLYSLQELDLVLDNVERQRQEAERELTSRLAVEQLETALVTEQERLKEIQQKHRLEQVDAETLRERSQQLDGRLYGGETNPRDLETVQNESYNVQRQLEQREIRLLELSLAAEETRNKCNSLEKQLSDTLAAWELRRGELTTQVEQLSAELERLSQERAQMSASVNPMELQRYEALRKTKGGRAVARVERGLCQVCRMSLPSQHLQKVRSGRQTVLCNSCGRILFLG